MDLSALGILDLQWDDSLSSIERWSLAPSQLVRTPDLDRAFFAGFRTQQMLDLLPEIFGEKVTIASDNGESLPARIVVTGSESELSSGVEQLSASVGFNVTLESPDTSRILASLPDYVEVFNDLPVTESVSTSGVKPITGYADINSTVGVFRDALAFNYSTYLRNDAEQFKACNYRLAKWAYDGLVGSPRIWYDAAAHQVIAPLGAQQFSTYERVLVSQSGLLPTKMSDNTIRYSNIGPSVASGLWKLLGGKG